jgi:UTP--glucose-1-phosphate uridylyltransferase
VTPTTSSVRKAVITAAGLGTRFLPATKAQPKEMLPVVDKPAIQYVVEEAVAAGIDDILIITGRSKRSIEDHFDRQFELEYHLDESGKQEQLDARWSTWPPSPTSTSCARAPLGLGHAVSVARKHVGDNPFVVLLGDEFMDTTSTLLPDMIASTTSTAGRCWPCRRSPMPRSAATAAPSPSASPTTSCRSSTWSRSRSRRRPRRTWPSWAATSSPRRSSTSSSR